MLESPLKRLRLDFQHSQFNFLENILEICSLQLERAYRVAKRAMGMGQWQCTSCHILICLNASPYFAVCTCFAYVELLLKRVCLNVTCVKMI